MSALQVSRKNGMQAYFNTRMCMKGNIYTDQKCTICETKLNKQVRRGFVCPKHPKIKATNYRVRFKKIHKRFQSYDEAERFLVGLRFKHDEGILDERDYKRDNPNSLFNLSRKYLEIKKQTVKHKTYKNLNNYMERVRTFFGDVNVKSIGYGDIEDFFVSQKGVSEKTKYNIKSCLNNFWSWLVKRQVIPKEDMPEFPIIKYTLKYRNIITKETQKDIINEVQRISYNANPKIWLGIKLLATYVSIRPGELINLKEWQIKTDAKVFIVNEKKENEAKMIPMIEEDAALIEEIRKQCDNNEPDMFFFRHLKDVNRARKDQKFGDKYLYKWWKKACKNLGIEDIDLYGGTKHSSCTALSKHLSPEQIKIGTGHKTNKAFERYYQSSSKDMLNVYKQAQVC